MPDKPVIVFVDDEENVLKSLSRLFYDKKYDIHTFTSAEEALNELEKLDADIVVSDQKMPGMKGAEFLEKAFEISPASNFLMLTAYPEHGLVAHTLNKANVCNFLTKPWNPAELLDLLEKIMEEREREMNLLNEVKGIKVSNKEKKLQVEWLKGQVKDRAQIILSKNKELSQLSKALEVNLWDTIRIFFGLIESKNPNVGNHSVRVSKLAKLFGRKMNLSENEITTLEIAALLHDIGKIALPDNLVEKAAKNSTTDGDRLLAMHPLIGQSSFVSIPQMKEIGHIIRSHHEKWNGRGFPDKLKTTEIPLLTRMLSICNKYDNMFHLRYKYHPKKKDKILSDMLSEGGISLDPDLTELFVSFISELNEMEEFEKNENKEIRYNPVKLLDAAMDKLYNEHERLRDGSIRIEKKLGEIPDIVCFPIKLREMYYDLIKNSIEAIDADGFIEIYIGAEKGYLKNSIKDSGCGIQKKELEKIFTAGYTTKDNRMHKGLGLAKFHEGLKAHAAKIELNSKPGRGTTFTFYIPLDY